MATRADRLAAFIRRHATSLHSIQLSLVSVDDSEVFVSAVDPTSAAEIVRSPNAAADTLLEELQDHCDTQGGACRYSVKLLNSDGIPYAVRIIKLQESEADDPFNVGPAGANSAGQCLVRVIEILTKLAGQSLVNMQSSYRGVIEEQRIEIMSLRKREQAVADATNRILEMEVPGDGEEKNQAMDRLVSLAEVAVPDLLSKWSGKMPQE